MALWSGSKVTDELKQIEADTLARAEDNKHIRAVSMLILLEGILKAIVKLGEK
jgi:hypothetical protein